MPIWLQAALCHSKYRHACAFLAVGVSMPVWLQTFLCLSGCGLFYAHLAALCIPGCGPIWLQAYLCLSGCRPSWTFLAVGFLVPIWLKASLAFLAGKCFLL